MLFCVIFNSLIAECRNTIYSFHINARPFIKRLDEIIECIFVVEHLQCPFYISDITPNVTRDITIANRDNRYAT